MNTNLQQGISEIATKFGRDRTRMMDVVREVQERFGCVSGEAMDLIARELGTHRVEVEGVVSFYAFFSKKPVAKVTVRLSSCPACKMKGANDVARALEKELGIGFGEVTPDGSIELQHTSCIGLCDQGPAALCNEVPVNHLTPDKVKSLVATLRSSNDPQKWVKTPGDGHNADSLIHAMVVNNIRKKGQVIFGDMPRGAALRKAVCMNPTEVIREIKTARLRGRGGAGFPTGMKWEFARGAAGDQKYILCNADEGEPGTFKDRVILTEAPDLVFEGMALAGYAIGATHGILYLRGEYAYLQTYLDAVLEKRRQDHLLGKNIAGKEGFHFDIRIQMGAGAYICGEESALISSCEGLRGSPKDRPPFPVEKGYLGLPSSVNNVETFCCAARIMEKGAAWFSEIGTKDSSGTKLFSVSGDCSRPGVYELPFGFSLREFLKEVGGEKAIAVQVGGPSGTCVGIQGFERKVGFEDLATGGSMMVFGPTRDMLEVASQFMEFFVEESCGYCTPCRVGNVLIRERLERVRKGLGLKEDLDYLEELCVTVKKMSRCGLGQTSPNPVQSTLANFRQLYEAKLYKKPTQGMQPSFDLNAALADAVSAQGRKPVFHQD